MVELAGPTPPTDSAPAIVARGLVKTYAAQRALDGFDLEVPRGVVWGLLGPNGAGKTTAVRTLTTLLAVEEGEAIVAGVDVRTRPMARCGLRSGSSWPTARRCC